MADHIIIGGHGKVSLLTMPLLREAGHSVTGVIRNPEHEHDIEAAGGKPLVLDVETALEDDLVRAFEGKDAVVWSAGAGGGNPGRTYAVDRDAAIRSMGAALRAGVRRYVMAPAGCGNRVGGGPGTGPDHGIAQCDPFHAPTLRPRLRRTLICVPPGSTGRFSVPPPSPSRNQPEPSTSPRSANRRGERSPGET